MEIAEQIESTVRDVGAKVRPQLDDAKRRLTSLNSNVTGLHQGEPGSLPDRRHRDRVPGRQDRSPGMRRMVVMETPEQNPSNGHHQRGAG